MQARLRTQPHLEYRPSGFHWRRRWPRRVLAIYAPENIQHSLLFSLRSHVIPDSRALAQKLTLLSDVAFAGVTERTMAIAPDIMDRLLVELCRFLIEAADVAREAAPARSFETAAYELACANAAVDSLRTAIATRDREMARDPLRDVAARLGVALDEDDPDWRRLAFRALRVMLDAEQENLRRDEGVFDGPTETLKAARDLVEARPTASTLPVMPRTPPMPPAPCSAPATAPVAYHDLTTSAASSRPFAPARQEDVQAPRVSTKSEPTPALSPEPTRARSSCPTIEKGAEDYIAARSLGYRSFKATEQVNETAGKSWARNTGPNVRGTKRLFSRMLGDKPFDQISDEDLRTAWEYPF